MKMFGFLFLTINDSDDGEDGEDGDEMAAKNDRVKIMQISRSRSKKDISRSSGQFPAIPADDMHVITVSSV